MKKKATKEYKWFKKHGSSHPGYPNAVKVTVTKNGHKYKGTAYAVKNSKYIKCEVRGVKVEYTYQTKATCVFNLNNQARRLV